MPARAMVPAGVVPRLSVVSFRAPPHGPDHYAGRVDPADAAELARRMRAAVVEETPLRRWAVLGTVLLVLTIVVLVVTMLYG